MSGSWKIGRLAGIDIYMHWTFLLLIAWIVFFYWLRASLVEALFAVVFVLTIFACVVLHELGHALMARRYGVPTRDITLLPIGGVARLQRIPEHPLEELAVAVAGPAVNVVIAGVLAVLLAGFAGTDALRLTLLGQSPLSETFFQHLMWVNIFLVAFNVLPAFPMDGGRVLRALLATRMEYTKATNIAASVGQFMAILFAIAGILLPSILLLIIAFFVYMGAEAEARYVQMRSIVSGIPVRDAMMRRFRVLSAADPLGKAVDELLAGSQRHFPVVEAGRVIGMLRREDIIRGLQKGDGELRVGDLMKTDCRTVDDREMLEQLFSSIRDSECSSMPVVHNGELVGLVTLENISELMMIRSALRQENLAEDVRELAEV